MHLISIGIFPDKKKNAISDDYLEDILILVWKFLLIGKSENTQLTYLYI